MSAHPRKMLKEITRVLEDYGIKVVGGFEFGRTHRRIQVTDGKKTAMVVISTSPSNRCYLNIAQSARRALREAP